MGLYTKTGDKGETSYIGGRISKASPLMHLLGAIDELNANLGVCTALVGNNQEFNPVIKRLEQTQAFLLDLGSTIADANLLTEEAKSFLKNVEMSTDMLEKEIDSWTEAVPALKEFILPGGSGAAAELHRSRTVCRRAERQLVAWTESPHPTFTSEGYIANLFAAKKYLNRLSDWLFALARYVNRLSGGTEVTKSSVAN